MCSRTLEQTDVNTVSHGVIELYAGYPEGNSELFRRPGRTAPRRTDPDIRIYRSPVKKSARRPTMIMSVIVTNQIPKNCTPLSKIRNVTAPAWPG